MRRHPLALFFTLAFALPWIVWGTGIARARGWIGFAIPQPLAFWVGLTLAAYGSAALTGGWPAVKDLLRRLIRFEAGPAWYIAGLFFTGLVAIVAIRVDMLLGGGNPAAGVFKTPGLLPSLLFQIFFFLLTEETAWRGFALPRLQARYSALTASLILGAAWGLWHLPLVFLPGSFQSQVPFIGFLISAVATSVLIAWVFNSTRGSVLLAAVFHAATDLTIAAAGVMTNGPRLFWIFVACQAAAAGLIAVTQGAARLSRDPDPEGAMRYPQGAA